MDKYFSKYTTYNVTEEYFVLDENNNSFRNIILCKELEYANSDKKEALNRILSSVGVNNDSENKFVALKKEQEFSINLLPENNRHIDLVAFGIEAKHLGLQGFEEKFQIYEIKNLRILLVGPIEDYLTDKQKKLQLWNALKEWKRIE